MCDVGCGQMDRWDVETCIVAWVIVCGKGGEMERWRMEYIGRYKMWNERWNSTLPT